MYFFFTEQLLIILYLFGKLFVANALLTNGFLCVGLS